MRTVLPCLVATALLLASCKGKAPASQAGADKSAAATAGTSTSAGDGGDCARVDDAVVAIMGPVGTKTHRKTGDVELCKWDSAPSTAPGMRPFFLVNLTTSARFAGFAKGIGINLQNASQAVKLQLTGFDDSLGYWNPPTHTFMLVAKRGTRTIRMSGSVTTQAPTAEALGAIAHTLLE